MLRMIAVGTFLSLSLSLVACKTTAPSEDSKGSATAPAPETKGAKVHVASANKHHKKHERSGDPR